MKKTLYNAMRNLVDINPIRFHMPGHKGRDILGMSDMAAFDFTEAYGLDNLHNPVGVIEESQGLMARAHGADLSFFLVNGASSGIVASIMSQLNDGDGIICSRNSHISLFNALSLRTAVPHYIFPDIIDEYGICGGISPIGVENALRSGAGVRAVFVTSPTYEGVTSDIAKIAEITHKYGSLLIVDEAHGSHFKYSDIFPKPALDCGADIVVQSHHKTLAAMGQGAVLHVKGSRADADKLKRNLSIMQTTSPSYVIMASLDRNRELLETDGGRMFREYSENLTSFRKSLADLKNIKLAGSEILGDNSVNCYDVGKLFLHSRGCGFELERILREEYSIYIEMATEDYIVLMTSFADIAKDYRAAEAALYELDGRLDVRRDETENSDNLYKLLKTPPKRAMSFKKCGEKKSVYVPLEDANGKISAGFITPYPPGIPLLVSGELFDGKTVDFLGNLAENSDISGIEKRGNKNYVRIIE